MFFSENLFLVKSERGYGLIDKQGNIVVEPRFSQMELMKRQIELEKKTKDP